MLPSEENVTTFLTFAPEAGEGKAFLYLEAAQTIEEAVTEYYENPDKFLQADPKSSSKEPPGYVSSKSAPLDQSQDDAPPSYAPTSGPPSQQLRRQPEQSHHHHTNQVIEAANVRARDEQQMQMMLQNLQYSYGIYNSDIEPEHEVDGFCNCAIHQYLNVKIRRLGVQKMWAKAVMYPGEKSYHDCYQAGAGLFSANPYRFTVTSPFPRYNNFNAFVYSAVKPSPRYYTLNVQQTIGVNAQLNMLAQRDIDAQEPMLSIWESHQPNPPPPANPEMSSSSSYGDEKRPDGQIVPPRNRHSVDGSIAGSSQQGPKPSRFASLKKVLAIKSPEEKEVARIEKRTRRGHEIRGQILSEEAGRWPNGEWRRIVDAYQDKVAMKSKIADLRARQPIQYLHLLRAGYFEPIPVAWANLASNPLKFSIEAASGWRGITPAWRGFEDTAEERLYWVLNHREGSVGVRLKPDLISAMNMARARMASAVEPPPVYFSANDTCHLQHTSDGYSKQVMPPPFRAYDARETSSDDTMILLDVSGSMDFDPVRPIYNEFLITGYTSSTQPKNKDVAKAIIRRFTDAMSNHSHSSNGHQLTTFANHASYIGTINHRNFDAMWKNVRIGGGTRVMTGWQQVKEMHFQKHSESATHHPVYGWQAGPQTPMLRLLLLLDGEATDMDEFELDLLGLSWVHVTIFLIGVDGCPHHHRHANELQRISEVNHHVSFVDAQGNTPERFVTHELLKRHLGYDISMAEFQELEQPPPYEF